MIDTLLMIITKTRTEVKSRSISNQLHTKLLTMTKTLLLDTDNLDKKDKATSTHKRGITDAQYIDNPNEH